MDSEVLYEVVGRVAVVTLNNPSRLNAFGAAMIHAATEHLETAAADPDVGAVVLTGAGRAFCAGGDLKAMNEQAQTGAPPQPIAAQVHQMIGTTRIVELLYEHPKPTIAAVNGPAAGGGLGLALATDLRIAATTAVFKTAFLSAGQTGDYGVSWTLPRLVGSSRARAMLLLDERVDAAAALAMGLVAEVHDNDALIPRALAIGERLAAAPAGSLAGIRANLRDADAAELRSQLGREAQRFQVNRRDPDSNAAVAAFATGTRP
jgi:2-(1,2-epoxy-1,2-dihydrophenyl)acetyl-CoA isomerase